MITLGAASVLVLSLVLLVLLVVVLLSRSPAARTALPALAFPQVHPAQVASLRDRLGHDVQTLTPGQDPVARQALSDAAERWSTCSLLLDGARSQQDGVAVQGELLAAWQAAAEGLTSSRLVRQRLGLDPGPDIPMPPARH